MPAGKLRIERGPRPGPTHAGSLPPGAFFACDALAVKGHPDPVFMIVRDFATAATGVTRRLDDPDTIYAINLNTGGLARMISDQEVELLDGVLKVGEIEDEDDDEEEDDEEDLW